MKHHLKAGNGIEVSMTLIYPCPTSVNGFVGQPNLHALLMLGLDWLCRDKLEFTFIDDHGRMLGIGV